MLARIKNYILLPREISPTERAHVEKINRLALILFWCHIPLFMWVAWMCETGVDQAVVLSCFVLVGPTIAYFRLQDIRQIAHVQAFTTMCLGGLLVHFGQGPMQIEMHFYFFTLLALLATYGNPAVNVTAAVTAAVHHLTLWILLPSSVFNYEASVWVVVVHAAFVVGETVGAVFIARSFYDNVIGLEKIVAARTAEVDQRNRDMRLVLDHVSQGLLTIDTNGRFSSERSRRVEEFLGEAPASGLFADWIRNIDTKAATWIEIGLEELREDVLPADVVLAQFPSRLRAQDGGERRAFSLRFNPIDPDAEGRSERMLVVISDITAELEQAETEAQQRENLRLFELLANDASGFEEFFDEANRMMRAVIDDHGLELRDVKRLLHTLKGNTALYGLDRVARRVHELEDAVEASGERPSADELHALDTIWRGIEQKVGQLNGGERAHQAVVPKSDLDALGAAVDRAEPYEALAVRLKRMRMEPTSKRLAILADQAAKIADRLGRRNIEIEHQADGDVRFENERWAAFWSSLVHVFRNAIDHGVEPESERIERGKASIGRIRLRAFSEDERLVVEIEDDGRGIDLDKLAERAREAGLPNETTTDLLEAIFADGVSTKDAVSEISGRGVGMAAVKAEVEALGGKVEVESTNGRGTRLAFAFPMGETVLPELQTQGD